MIQYYKLYKVADDKETEQVFEITKGKKKTKVSEFYHISEVEKFVKKNKGNFLLKTFVK